MYRGLSDYLGRTVLFHSNQVIPSMPPPSSTVLGRFVARPDTGDTSGFGSTQSHGQESVQVIGSLTAASSSDVAEEKSPSVGNENV